jgi:S1-C subfamily serine protease
MRKTKVATIRSRVEAATIWLPTKEGQGVLVTGGYILTAAHCVEWDGEGRMPAGGDYFVEKVETRCGRKLLAEVRAVEPVSDIAVLDSLDPQEASDEAGAFEAFVEAVAGISLCTRIPKSGKAVPVQVLTHKGEWITGRVINYRMPGASPIGTLYLEADTQIEGGTSGGPVITKAGELIGLISWSSAGQSKCGEGVPVPWLALPRWLADRIVAPHEVGAT